MEDGFELGLGFCGQNKASGWGPWDGVWDWPRREGAGDVVGGEGQYTIIKT